MELKDFIKTSLVEISEGILEASEELKNTDAVISPKDFQVNSENSQAMGRTKIEESATRVVQKIEFDISVLADERTQGGGGFKISVMSIGLNAEGKKSLSYEKTSRIRFTVPMVLPSKKLSNKSLDDE